MDQNILKVATDSHVLPVVGDDASIAPGWRWNVAAHLVIDVLLQGGVCEDPHGALNMLKTNFEGSARPVPHHNLSAYLELRNAMFETMSAF